MSDARFFRVRSRLGSQIKRDGGISVQQAIKGAEGRLTQLRASCEAALAVELDYMTAHFGEGADRRDASFDDFYKAAGRAMDVIGGVPGTGIEGALTSLCSLIDVCQRSNCWNWEAVDIHLSVIAVLRKTGVGLPPLERDRMIFSLRSLTRFTAEKLAATPELVS